jgi:hypothetical protein
MRDARTLSYLPLRKGGRIVFSKKVNGYTYYVEEVRTGKKQLAAVTMYKKSTGAPVGRSLEGNPPPLYVRNVPRQRKYTPRRAGCQETYVWELLAERGCQPLFLIPPLKQTISRLNGYLVRRGGQGVSYIFHLPLSK